MGPGPHHALSPAERADMLAASGRTVEGLQLLRKAIAAGDPDAAYTLALWYLTGSYVPRNLASCREYFSRAGERGHVEAKHFHIALLGNGTGGPRRWREALERLVELAKTDDEARLQLQTLKSMVLDDTGDPVSLPPFRQLSESPHVLLFPQLLTEQECAFLGATAEPRLEPSVVVDPRSGRTVAHPVRTSDSTGFSLPEENPAIHALNRRLAAASGTDVAQGEPLQVLRYRPGQQYRTHSDALPGADNQRILTMLVYLNDDYEGGETCFASSGLKVKGSTGDALLFRNADKDGRPDPAAVHAGLPVKSGSKLLASRWIRSRPIDPGKPLR